MRAAIHLFLLLAVCCFLLTKVQAADVAAGGQPGKTENSAIEKVPDPAEAFEYILTGRPDPFTPFIEPKVATQLDPNEIVDEDVELSGMQLFEPGQLTLVAILFSGGQKMAMVEDVTGKGYVINEGVLVGRHGVVSQIATDQVVITETTRTRAGKELINTVVMRLNTEGDK